MTTDFYWVWHPPALVQTPSDIGAWYSEVKVPIYWAVAADRIVAITKEVVLIVKFKIIKRYIS